MIMIGTFFKIVRNVKGKPPFRSAMEDTYDTKLEVRYSPGRITFPRKPTKLFVFDTLDNARNFTAYKYARPGHDFEIYEVEAGNAVKQSYILACAYSYKTNLWLKRFWTEFNPNDIDSLRELMKGAQEISRNDVCISPRGTYTADWVKLIKKVA